MRIKKLHLQDFGQFHDKDISLGSGINVLYGASETGKTTIKNFIVDMLYGIDKEQASGTDINHYEKTKPISGTGFSGSMEVDVEGGDYQIDRNFLQQDKSTSVRDLDNSKDIMLQEDNSLMGTLLHTPKSVYENTLCMDRNGIVPGKELADDLSRHILDAASAKAGDIDVAAALEQLEKKKKTFSNTGLMKREQELTAQISLERDFDAELEDIKKECEKAKEQIGKQEKLQFTPIKNPATEARKDENANLSNEGNEKEESAQPLTKRQKDIQMLQGMGKQSILDNVFVIWFLSLLMIAVFVAIAQIVPGNVPQLKMAIMGFGAALVLMTTVQVLSRRSKLHLLLEEIEIEQGFQKAKEGTPGSEEQKAAQQRLTELKLKEQNVMKERNQQQKLLAELNHIKEQIQANVTETEALDLAIRTIKDISEDIYDSFGSILNEPVSKLVSRITDHRYQEVKIDNQLKVSVKQDASFISMDYLSIGTAEQIYFALRLAVGNMLITENLPIIIDDIFVNYDNQRLKETLSCLSECLDRQIIIFTLNPSVQQMFTDLGVESNYIAL